MHASSRRAASCISHQPPGGAGSGYLYLQQQLLIVAVCLHAVLHACQAIWQPRFMKSAAQRARAGASCGRIPYGTALHVLQISCGASCAAWPAGVSGISQRISCLVAVLGPVVGCRWCCVALNKLTSATACSIDAVLVLNAVVEQPLDQPAGHGVGRVLGGVRSSISCRLSG